MYPTQSAISATAYCYRLLVRKEDCEHQPSYPEIALTIIMLVCSEWLLKVFPSSSTFPIQGHWVNHQLAFAPCEKVNVPRV